MTENSDERRGMLLVAVAIYVTVDLLALVPVLVIALRSPDLLWFALGPYLFLTGARAWQRYCIWPTAGAYWSSEDRT